MFRGKMDNDRLFDLNKYVVNEKLRSLVYFCSRK